MDIHGTDLQRFCRHYSFRQVEYDGYSLKSIGNKINMLGHRFRIMKFIGDNMFLWGIFRATDLNKSGFPRVNP